MRSRIFVFIAPCLVFFFLSTASLSLSAPGQEAPAPQPLSKTRVAALSAVSAFSPGVALLIISYQVKKERNAGGENDWLLNFLWLIWVVAFVDFFLDMVPGVAQVNQFLEYAIIWYIAYILATCFNVDFPLLAGILLGSAVQAGRHAYSSVLDASTSGLASPFRSTIENFLAGAAVYFLT